MLIMKSRPGETMAAFAARAQQYAAGTAVALYFPPQGELQATAEAMQRAFPDSLTLGVATVRLFDLGALESGTTLLFLFAQDDADVRADAMLLENISKAPIGYVLEMRRRVAALHPIETNVACLEFCTNNEEMLVTTLTAMLAPLHVPLFGGTAFHTDSLTKAPSDVHFCVAGTAVRRRLHSAHLEEHAWPYLAVPRDVLRSASGDADASRDKSRSGASPAHRA